MTRLHKSIVKRLQHQETLLGGWGAIPSALSAEIMSRLGFDFVCIDMQHGLLDYQTALSLLQAVDVAGACPVVRVPCNDSAAIGKALDAGALGIIVPMTNSAAEVEAVVRAARYAPEGERSFGPMRAALVHGPEYALAANRDIAIFPMIETAEALDNLEAIASVEGISGLFVGPYDLSLSLGLEPGNNDGTPEFDQALARVLEVCQRKGIAPGVMGNEQLAAMRARQGFRFVVVSTDVTALATALATALGKVRAELAGEEAVSADASKGVY
ncbi:HpcH/HpaI aldolase family protein [Aestuariirhabdus litorea]|uniref:Aldolase n=1 Tax=Aestuariirhabdus litorea TaxID=2528527 RepID=A0A3P3VLI7_9GAMM|nr:aldolase/citrate lyase family protein [Aestuariirhabdus litorea]RRJ83274.1 aldolase [Aestuariirhabdus litorea]RWW93433.1 aldolase [Endozoicomonadaceae bacterium GTF-13]